MPEQPEPPPDPFSELAGGAMAMHEMFTSLLAAGFARYEALWLVAALSQGLKPPSGWGDPEKPDG